MDQSTLMTQKQVKIKQYLYMYFNLLCLVNDVQICEIYIYRVHFSYYQQ